MTIKTYDERAAEIPRGKTFVPEHLLRAEVAELRSGIEKLRHALIEYRRAGVGNSTDHRMQLSAVLLAHEALEETK